MAEALECLDGAVDGDRHVDANGFLNNQFDIFVHDYREYTEAQACGCSSDSDSVDCAKSCGEKGTSKRHLVNTIRRLQKAIFSLQSLSLKDLTEDLIAGLSQLHHNLSATLKNETSEFTPSSVPLPDYDTVDMQLLLGENEVKATRPFLTALEEEKAQSEEHLSVLLAQADILLREASHLKEQVAA